MGSMDFDRLRDEVRMRCGRSTALDASTDWYGRWVNAGYLELVTRNYHHALHRKFVFPELEASTTAATVDGTAYVSVPSDCLITRHLHNNTDDAPMRPLIGGYTKYVTMIDKADTTAEAAPTIWCRAATRY